MALGDDILGSEGERELVIQPISGWRAWNLNPSGDVLSPQRGDAWSRGELVWDKVCRCYASRRPSGVLPRLKNARLRVLYGLSPVVSCCCGINAYATSEQLEQSAYLQYDAVGRCELTGEVRGYELGWRSERAKIVELWASSVKSAHQVEQAAKRVGAQYRGVWRPHDDHVTARAAAYHASQRSMHRSAGLVVAFSILLVCLVASLPSEALPLFWSLSALGAMYLIMLITYRRGCRALVAAIHCRPPGTRSIDVLAHQTAGIMLLLSAWMSFMGISIALGLHYT